MPTARTIFISYRRSDSDYVTDRIHEKLRSHFGSSVVFKDTHSIPLGQDFRPYITEALDASQVVIAVIGIRWLDSIEQRGVEKRHDYVKEELETALGKGDIPVIPLLIEGVPIPSEQELPDSLKALAYRNAAQVRPALDFNHDIERLISGIEESIGLKASVAVQRKLSDFEQVKLQALKKRRTVLVKQYEAASDQLNGMLLKSYQVIVQSQIEGLEQDIQQVDNKISELLS